MDKLFHRLGSVAAAFVRSVPRIVSQPSVWPECPRKSSLRRYIENIYLRFRDGGVCSSYNGMGMDLVGHGLRDYVSDTVWLRKQRSNPSDYNILLLDKYLFFEYLHAHSIPSVPIFAHTLGGQCYLGDKVSSVNEVLDYCRTLPKFFLKKADDMCGRMMMRIAVRQGRFIIDDKEVDVASILQSSNVRYILQPVVENHDQIKKINFSTLNTLRITTYCDNDGRIQIWNGGTIRIGRKGGTVDNYAQGGVCVAVHDDGTLRELGFCHDERLCFKKVSAHPDSGVVFLGFRLPFYKESVELVKRAHLLFPDIKSIGWDVAITQEGPLLLEGNHDWDLEFLEVTHSIGYRNKFKEVFG